jgi:hypothetical protein
MRNKSFGLAAVALCSLFAASAANAAATIAIINGNAAGVGFNDSTPAVPVGGNTGTTLGQQRLIAFQAAAAKWGATLNSSVTIQVLATFEPLTCTATGAVLGSAGATSVFSDYSNMAFAGTWYSGALADKLQGVDLDPGFADIRARFNSRLGLFADCLPGQPFYLGLDNNHGPLIDLVTVLTHEFGHGLGFQTFTSGQTGAVFAEQPAVWDHFMRDQTLGLRWVEMTDAQRAFSALNNRKLVWTGANVTAAAPGVLSVGVPFAQISGPAAGAAAGTYDVGTASFGPILGTPGVYGEVMPVSPAAATVGEACNPLSAIDKAAVNGKIAFVSRGVCGFTIKAKNAQDAGAIAVIFGDNAAGAPPPGLGGTDVTVTIPSVRITLDAANKLRTALAKRSRVKSGVFATLSVNTAQLAGADPLGFVQLYTPVPFSGGSSVSHYDTGAFPNLLMEPAINGDLTHEVIAPYDLTYALFKDIGW